MKVILQKTKKGKIVCKYKAADGLIFEKKEHCIFYESKYMWRKK
jgi:hypothetical protein